MHSSSSQIYDYSKATQSGSHLSPIKLSSVQTTPEQTAIDTDTATIQEISFLIARNTHTHTQSGS